MCLKLLVETVKVTPRGGRFPNEDDDISGFVVAPLLMAALAGCEKKSGDAVVLAKEHISAAAPIAETPNTQSAASPNEELRPIGDDEITVDGYVMKPEVRGTRRDPRTLKAEQWLVKVRMITDGGTFNVQAEQEQFDGLRDGDRVKVRYRVGKYTNTVWGAELQ